MPKQQHQITETNKLPKMDKNKKSTTISKKYEISVTTSSFSTPRGTSGFHTEHF